MSINPSVTVIIPYKNNLKYFPSTLNSVFRQTYKNFKILIIYDDVNKSDLYNIKKFINNKKKIIKNFPKVKFVINNKNLGAGYSRNKGIKKSNTKYIAFLDSDDLWAKNKLRNQISYMEKNNQVFSHTSYFIINNKNRVISIREAKPKITFDELLKSCDIGLSTVILRLSFIKKNNYYFPKINTKEDFVLWLNIARNLKIIKGINKKLTYYRKTDRSLSSNKFTSLINGYKVYRNYMRYSKLNAIYHLIILSLNYLKKNLK